jgi:hypothetical protein
MASKLPHQVITEIFEKYIGMHENNGTNRAPWLDVIQAKAKMIGQPWCALIIFWEILPKAELLIGRPSVLSPAAHVRTAARLNKPWLHKDPKAGDIGFLGVQGSTSGHLVYVTGTGKDSGGEFYNTIEGNTSAVDGSNRDGGEVARHKRYRGTHGRLEELGFATPFPVVNL